MIRFRWFGMPTLRTERQSAWMSKIKNGGLDEYGTEPFELQQFGTAGVKGVNVWKYCNGAWIPGMKSIQWRRSIANITAAGVGPNCMLLPEPLYGSTPLGLFRDQQQKSARQKIIQECDNKTSNIAYQRCMYHYSEHVQNCCRSSRCNRMQ